MRSEALSGAFRKGAPGASVDIHSPQGPVNSIRDFWVHIAIVTIGILIALSLEGLIETVRNRALVRETRANFQAELRRDQYQSRRELARLRQTSPALQQLVMDLPGLAKAHPEQIGPRLAAIQSSGYFLSAESWQAALSTGALAHMSTDEVQRYATTFYIIHEYTEVQKQGYLTENHAKAFTASRPVPRREDLPEAADRIAMFAEVERDMLHVCEQMDEQIRSVLPAGQGGGDPAAR